MFIIIKIITVVSVLKAFSVKLKFSLYTSVMFAAIFQQYFLFICNVNRISLTKIFYFEIIV